MLEDLLIEIKGCQICKDNLPFAPNPVLKASETSKLLIVGQAPGTKVHASGIPWDDQSGKLLREWLKIDMDTFYNEEKVAIIPMGFCYPGKGPSGDLPPRKECAEHWHQKLLNRLPNVEFSLLIGQYAQNYFLGDQMKRNLTETVNSFHEYLPKYLPLPHPSPRNRFWFKKNPWFEKEVLPYLQHRIKEINL